MTNEKESNYLRVSKENLEERLDKFLFKHLKKLSFDKIQKLIRKGFFKVNSKKTKYNYKIKVNDKISLGILSEQEKNKKSKQIYKRNYSKQINDIKKQIIFEDENILVLNKPSGIAVQGGSKIKFSIDDISPYLTDKKVKLRLVHRIDKDTSGILVLAKSKETSRDITELFRNNKVFKKYLAIVIGRPAKDKDIILMPINKKLVSGHDKVVIDINSKKAANTLYKVIKKKDNLSLLEVFPKTGRTHQIRVHLQSIKTPILGDKKYFIENNNSMKTEKINFYLHAKEISFMLKKKKYNLSAEIPDYFKNKIKLLEGKK